MMTPLNIRSLAHCFVVAALIAVSIATANAQSPTLSGLVLDDRTSAPLAGVTVTIDGAAETLQTDADGRFTAVITSGAHALSAALIGYALHRVDVLVPPDRPLAVTIRLAEGAGSFSDRVTVSGSGDAPADRSPGGSTLHGRELQNARGVLLDDPLRAIQALPSATAPDDFYSEFAVRGSAFRHVNLTLDGIGTRYLMHSVNGVADGGSIAMVNTETLGAVSLLPGGYPQTVGRRLGASVDLTTREGSRERFGGRLGLSGTSATALGEGPLPGARGSWLVSLRRSYLDYLIRRIDPEATFAFGFSDLQTKLVFDVTPRHHLQLTLLAGRAVFDGEKDQRGVNETAAAQSTSWLSALSWRFTPTPHLSLTQRLYTTGQRYDNRNPAGAPLDVARFSDIGWRADGIYAVASDRIVIGFGGDVLSLRANHERTFTVRANSAPVLLGHYDERSTAASAYAQARVPAGRLTLTPGVRLDRWGPTGDVAASPWVNAEARVRPSTTVRFGSGIYRQFAEYDQVAGLNGGGDLSPERAVHADLSLEQRLRSSTSIRLTAYRRSERDVLWQPELTPRRLANGSLRQGFIDAPWVNGLQGAARGVELVVRRDAPTGLSGWAGYAYGHLRYRDRVTGDRFFADADQRHSVSIYANYRLTSRATISSKYRYGSNYPMVGYIGDAHAPLLADGQPAFYAVGGERNTLRLPAYARLDVRGDHAFTIAGRRLVLFTEIANVLNHSNFRNVPFTVDRSGRIFEPTQSQMPIVPSGGFVIEF